MTWEVIAVVHEAGHAEIMTATQTRTVRSAESTLRKVLLANTEFSIATGLAGLIFGAPIAETLGVDQVWLIRLLGTGLLGFAGVVFLISRSPQPVLQQWSGEISHADFGWVIGTVVIIALGWLSRTGAIIMAVIAVAVLALGLAQHYFRRQMLAAS